jgi:uncharacterized protein (TIGR00288 family)
MTVPYTRAPHQGSAGRSGIDSPNAALLIDFDNVTMGMRSDLSKELKNLLGSDVIKGKVSVQRAYADWRRYPQYIVPLSEASVDLIFAPAYGSNKKNATDIRMAIDALELVFIRPEIGTYILLTGDSDFSSLVLKLKEYGKYVIGVGIQESSSDILVQNCDEYYSYTSLTGLTKTTDLSAARARDPWVLVKESVARMVQRGDVMRSDRLKQVMQELDPTFDEGAIGFSKFSKFLAEAASRGVLKLQKMENGQYEIEAGPGGRSGSRSGDEGRGRRERGRGGRGRRDRGPRADDGRSGSDMEHAAEADAADNALLSVLESPDATLVAAQPPRTDGTGRDDAPLTGAYDALREALAALRDAGRYPVRDSDVKRKILDIRPGFDETELGFPKFSRFLQEAEDRGVIRMQRSEAGNYEVSLSDAAPDAAASGRSVGDPGAGATGAEPTVIEVEPPKRGLFGLRLGPRRGTTRRRTEESSSLFGWGGSSRSDVSPASSGEKPHQGASVGGAVSEASGASEGPDEDRGGEGAPSGDASQDRSDDARPKVEPVGEVAAGGAPIEELGLPSDGGAIVRYLTHRYKGVGDKTAEALVEAFGSELFRTMLEDPDAIMRTVPAKRAEQVLEAWKADYERRVAAWARGDNRSKGSGRG